MDEIGVVKSVHGTLAVVLVEKKSACDQCSASCKLGSAGAEIESLNEARARVGQTVRVVLRPSSYLKGTVLVYGIPSLALVVGAVAGKEFVAVLFPGRDPDAISAAVGFGSFLLSFVLVKLWSMFAQKNKECKPVIKEILGEAQEQ